MAWIYMLDMYKKRIETPKISEILNELHDELKLIQPII